MLFKDVSKFPSKDVSKDLNAAFEDYENKSSLETTAENGGNTSSRQLWALAGSSLFITSFALFASHNLASDGQENTPKPSSILIPLFFQSSESVAVVKRPSYVG